MGSGKRNYIIYTWPWSEDKGGVMFMHQLAHELNEQGETALLWRIGPIIPLGLRGRLRWLRTRGPMLTHPALNTPLARRRDLTADSIVIYPELVPGNPLKAKNVVRWLLYKPGLRHPYDFGPDEMFFRVSEMFDLPEVTGGAPDLNLYSIHPAYRNESRPGRKGTCYMVRKGDAKPRIPDTETAEAICIDGMSHEQINEVFNRCDRFYSYDEATMFSLFAALCGCQSIVVPGLYDSHDEWVQNNSVFRYGVAYGTAPAELAHADATRDLLLEDLRAREAEGSETVRRFVELTKKRFWGL